MIDNYDKSTKRKSELVEYCVFCDTEYTCQSRWLTLELSRSYSQSLSWPEVLLWLRRYMCNIYFSHIQNTFSLTCRSGWCAFWPSSEGIRRPYDWGVFDVLPGLSAAVYYNEQVLAERGPSDCCNSRADESLSPLLRSKLLPILWMLTTATPR